MAELETLARVRSLAERFYASLLRRRFGGPLLDQVVLEFLTRLAS